MRDGSVTHGRKFIPEIKTITLLLCFILGKMNDLHWQWFWIQYLSRETDLSEVNGMQASSFLSLQPLLLSLALPLMVQIIRCMAESYGHMTAQRTRMLWAVLIQLRAGFPPMPSSSSVTKLLGLDINNPSVDERALLSEHIFSTFIELLVSEGLALSWLDVSILVQSHFFFPITHYHILINVNNMLYYSCDKVAVGHTCQAAFWIRVFSSWIRSLC